MTKEILATIGVISLAVVSAVLFGTYVLDLGSSGNVPAESPNDSVGESVEVGDGVERVVDAEAGVVCWKTIDKKLAVPDGISCLPLNDTRLGGGSR